MQASWSQMELGELIYYETNLAACYEAEYLLSLQYTQNCHCSEPYINNTCSINYTETLPVEGEVWMENSGEVKMETGQDNTNLFNQDHQFNTRKRPSSSNTDSEDSSDQSTSSQLHVPHHITPSDGGSTSICSDMMMSGDNSLSGHVSPHMKRVCLGLQQCHS